MKTRVLSGLIMLPLLIIIILRGWVLFAGCFALSLLAVYEFFRVECKLGLFENPYLDKAYAVANVWSEDALAYGALTQEKAVVMLKNNGVIKPADGEKKTVYVPQVFTPASQGRNGVTPARWAPVTDNAALDRITSAMRCLANAV